MLSYRVEQLAARIKLSLEQSGVWAVGHQMVGMACFYFLLAISCLDMVVGYYVVNNPFIR